MSRRASHRYLLNFSLLTLSGALFASACSDDTQDNPGGGAGTAGSSALGGEGGSGWGGEAGSTSSGGKAGSSGSAGSAGSGATSGSGGAAAGEGSGGTSVGGVPTAGGEAGSGGSAEAGAGGEGGEVNTLPRILPQELADESAADYADNEHGIITGATLKAWQENWTTNRPAGVTGKLVILQIGSVAASSQAHVPENGSNVVSYLVSSSELLQDRDNGLSKIEAEIPDGAAADAFVKKYGIDVSKDFVVLTFEQLGGTSNGIVQQVGRAWLLLSYWGYPKERLGILNGSVNWNATNQGLPLATTAAATPPNDGTSSVRDLRVDHTAYVVTLSELLDILNDRSDLYPRDEVSVVDARGGAEALGLLKSTSSGKQDCPSYTGTAPNARCSPPFEGRLKGAESVPWPQFLTNAQEGFRFPEKSVVKATFDSLSGYEPGNVTIQYCRTNMRSMVTGLVAGVILGYPTRFYDTSFIEWSHLAYGPTAKTRVLPENSRFRTDLASLTEHAIVAGNYVPGGAFDAAVHTVVNWVDGPNYNADADISDTPVNITPTATNTNRSVDDDRAYKL